MKRSLLWKIAMWAVITFAVLEIIGAYIIFTTLKSEIQHNTEVLQNIHIPVPRDGIDGKSVTTDQISQAVTTYMASHPISNGTNGSNASPAQIQQAVDNYLVNNPVKNGTDGVDGRDGTDGTNGTDGKTPQLRCNIDKNRWEVRYSSTETWQKLNGDNVKCVISQ